MVTNTSEKLNGKADESVSSEEMLRDLGIVFLWLPSIHHEAH